MSIHEIDSIKVEEPKRKIEDYEICQNLAETVKDKLCLEAVAPKSGDIFQIWKRRKIITSYAYVLILGLYDG